MDFCNNGLVLLQALRPSHLGLQCLKELQGHTSYINCVALNQDSTMAVSVSDDGHGCA
jgi:hypothetical protein